jgi:hypothetical protein
MTKIIVTRQPNVQAIEQILIKGDLAPMNDAQRLVYVKSLCKAMGISILFQPFDYIKFDGKVQLYANRKCTDQLRKKHKISIKIVKREFDDGLYIVTAQASMGNRADEAVGAIAIKGLQGLAKANALMKCETKAKRRVTLSIMGLGMLDETEIQDALEREEKIAQELKIEETSAQLAQTAGEPEFVTERPAPSMESGAPPTENSGTPASYEYKLKSIKAVRGKPLSKVPPNKLVSWLKNFDEMVARGESLHADVQDDAFHIRAFLEEAAIAHPAPKEPGKNG